MAAVTLRIVPCSNRQEMDKIVEAVKARLAAGERVELETCLHTPKLRSPVYQTARNYGGIIKVVLQLGEIDRKLKIPTYAEDVDQIEVSGNTVVDEDAAEFFRRHEKNLINDPVKVFRDLQQSGHLLRYIPEYKGAIGLDQHSPYHTYSVFDHIMEATAYVAGTNLKMVWSVLLHDIGKGYPGIKQFLGVVVEPYASYSKKDRVVIENGERIREGLDSGESYRVNGEAIPKQYIRTDLVGHFYDHENVGAQLALRILPRIGYTTEFAHEVAALVQLHMTMPRDMDTIAPNVLKKWYAKVGRYASDLMMIRMADDKGK
ncbi:hypothetical protein [Effusibacillus lacus]|uniref:HD domain-containing protein n=1 Tax=Effusibacillus lacus TaxID=1348429 RepID=A0A292YMH3_9BACL|nr:hypothetical protein [Effusibacillus lacus]TCS76794.1 hypothetical protein EDD64_10114 [Effusibacillus lacus]GAX91128.1 hypothetical protein EFBL_2794 [Effusibacillus lacus]